MVTFHDITAIEGSSNCVKNSTTYHYLTRTLISEDIYINQFSLIVVTLSIVNIIMYLLAQSYSAGNASHNKHNKRK